MNRPFTRSQLPRIAAGVMLVAMLAAGMVAYRGFRDSAARRSGASDQAAPRVVADFFTSLAALDVEENDRAARILQRAIQSEPREPALWANLTVAHLRLRDLPQARDALATAWSLASDSRELGVLRAEVLEHSGELQAAIEQLRQTHRQWPENIAAAYSLFTLLGQVRSAEADAERLSLLADILSRDPDNLRARCEQARLAATLAQSTELRAAMDVLLQDLASWPAAAGEHLEKADVAARDGDWRQAAQSLTFFENLLKREPQYQQSLDELGVGPAAAIGTPQRNLLRLKLPAVEAAEADVALRFEQQAQPQPAARLDLVSALVQAGERRSTLMSLAGDMLQVGESAALPFPGSSAEATRSSLAAVDLNFDFRQDLVLVGLAGCRLYLQQEDGSFVPHPTSLDEFNAAWQSVWPIDVEADGDLDLLLSDHLSPPVCIRNNGDMTFTAIATTISAAGVVELCAADFDGDGDIDLATLDRSGAAQIWHNERGGNYVAAPVALVEPCVGLTTGDVDRDGRIDLIAMGRSGEVRQASRGQDGQWSIATLTHGSPAAAIAGDSAGNMFLATADIDNNGAIDLVASTGQHTSVWLQDSMRRWTLLSAVPQFLVTAIADLNDDGLLDLVGMDQNSGCLALNRSRAGYGWQVIQCQANTAAGDKRINPFGIGGRIEIRASGLVQAATIQSPSVHFGLGRQQRVDVARIVWPNGTVQAEFDLPAQATLAAQQRLKGSCPWVFAFDGQTFQFVKDFIWRSPLGLRINAQTTAGVTQTEDWIKIPGRQLAASRGAYQLRITAELWESHFFDHVRLLAVDHAAEVEVLVDERFVPSAAPRHRVRVVSPRQSLGNLVDHRGRSLADTLRTEDGVYAAGFELGPFQGVAEEHWVEFEVPPEVAADRRVLIIGNGWVYPTDSSLNVALAQGGRAPPFGLILEQRDPHGNWQVLDDNLGFPAGKHKDVLIPLPDGALTDSRHFRLRTNLEIYWDSFAWSYELPAGEARVSELPVRLAELRYRGYSRLLPVDRRRPDTPVYELAGTEPRWLDLAGYYTRFGDVRELLESVDDRYVIMNAGDELVFEFDAGGDPAAGWQRDFVLVGDGWVKDGDFNTAFSQSLRPLPAHADADYSGPAVPLEEDPVYRRYRDDWRNYHTRYVVPRQFQRGLWPRAPHVSNHQAGSNHQAE